MIDLFLKFTNEAAATAALYTAGAQPKFAHIDTIGIIYKPTGKTDEDGNAILAALDGWHVNVRAVDEDPTTIEQYAVTPAAPMRVWA